MRLNTDISEPIIEALYCEALVLADEVRATFDLPPVGEDVVQDDAVSLSRSVEGLRTTTRMMHILAWLLNQRAYFSGDLSERQLRNHGELPEDRHAEPDQFELLDQATQEIVIQTEDMHRRIARLDKAWRDGFAVNMSGIHQLRGQLESAFQRG